jgi:hypothetical protein
LNHTTQTQTRPARSGIPADTFVVTVADPDGNLVEWALGLAEVKQFRAGPEHLHAKAAWMAAIAMQARADQGGLVVQPPLRD